MRHSTKQTHNLARAYLAGKLPNWKWLHADEAYLNEVIQMAEKIRQRKARRGQTKIKRTFPNSDYHHKPDNKSCSYCYADADSYVYKGHGRVRHGDTRNLRHFMNTLGEELGPYPNCECDLCWGVPGVVDDFEDCA